MNMRRHQKMLDARLLICASDYFISVVEHLQD